VGLFHPTGTSRVVIFRVLRYIQSVAISSTFCFPRCFCLFSDFFQGLRGFPYLLAVCVLVFASRPRFALAPGLRFSLGLVSVMRFSSASELCSWLSRALPVAWFHPYSVTALSLDFLTPFEVSGFLCPAQVPEPRNFAFPTFGVSTPLGFLCTMEVGIPRCYPSGSPSLRFLPFTFLQIQARFRSWLIGSPKGL
jgi:hypothetical protein